MFCWARATEFVICFALGLRNFCVGVSLPGSPVCWAFAAFLLERRGGKFVVELELLIILCHGEIDFLFCFTLNFHFIFERRHGDNGIELARFLIISFEVVRSCATFSLAFTRFLFERGRGKVFLGSRG